MRLFSKIVAGSVFGLSLGLAASSANAIVTDFTAAIWQPPNVTTASITNGGVTAAAVSPVGEFLNTQLYDGTVGPHPCGSLACFKDGIGTDGPDDEVTYGVGASGTNEVLRISFSTPQNISAIEFLDFFGVNTLTNDPAAEIAQWRTDTGIFGSALATASSGNTDNTGYLSVAVALAGVSYIEFFAHDGTVAGFGTTVSPSNTDFAIASITHTVVPIPGAVWLFGSGVLGLLGIGYTRRRRAAA